MPGGDTVWPLELADLLAQLATAGLALRWLVDRTAAHAARARRLHDTFVADRASLTTALGDDRVAALIGLHARWVEWLTARRVRKLALVCQRLP